MTNQELLEKIATLEKKIDELEEENLEIFKDYQDLANESYKLESAYEVLLKHYMQNNDMLKDAQEMDCKVIKELKDELEKKNEKI